MDATAEVVGFPHLEDVLLVLDVLYLLFALNGLLREAFEGIETVVQAVSHQLYDAKRASTENFKDLKVFEMVLLVVIMFVGVVGDLLVGWSSDGIS